MRNGTMRNARIVLGLLMALAAGCGSKKDAPPDATTPLDDGKGATTTPPVPPVEPPPPPKPAEWETDVSKHAMPTAAATGKLGGEAFAPVAQFMGDTLSFRVLKDMNPEREIKVTFSPEQVKAIQGLKLVVKPDQASGPDVPEVTLEFPDPKPNARFPMRVEYKSGYALTLELGKKADGKIPGKVYLSLLGDEKHFLAGSFAAEWVRLASLPPDPDEAPFVHGSVGSVNAPSNFVRVGYIGLTPSGMVVYDAIGLTMQKGVWAKSDVSKPRASLIAAGEGPSKPGRYDHTRLEPGRYFVFAGAGATGPSAWQWVTVEPASQIAVHFAIDGSKAGKVEVTVPAGTPGKVILVPPGDPSQPTPVEMMQGMAIGLGLFVEPEGGKATFPHVSPGKYEVRAGELVGTVTVEVGKTATVALMPPKK